MDHNRENAKTDEKCPLAHVHKQTEGNKNRRYLSGYTGRHALYSFFDQAAPYNETTMLSELDKAHQQNNKAILRRQDYYRDFWCGRANGMVYNNSADSQKG